MSAMRRALGLSPLTWALAAALIALVLVLPHLFAPMHWLFPQIERPVYERASFVELDRKSVV
jgi:osmoprotectant transport system permease protein